MPLVLPPALVESVNAQSAVLFLGAAASYGATHEKQWKIPSGLALRDVLSDKFLGGEEKKKPLTSVADMAVNETSLVSVQQFIRETFHDFHPADFHQLVPRFRWHGIATTNYDLLMERAYSTVGKTFQELVPFVKDGQAVETQMKKAVDGVQYLKLHGCIDHYLDSSIPLILAGEQYARHSQNRTRLFERLKDWGREFPLVFCGYSISDPHIQNILYELFAVGPERPMYYLVDPYVSVREERFWASKRVTAIKATFEEFMRALESTASPLSQALPKSIGGGTSTLRSHYRVANAPETAALGYFLSADVDHVRKDLPIGELVAKEFYRGGDNSWAPISAGLDVPRAVTDSLIVDAILASEDERPGAVDLFAVKGPAGNGKTIVLKRTAWAAAHDYDKVVLFLKQAGSIRPEVIEEIYRYTQERIFLFIDRAAGYVEELQKLIDHAKSGEIRLTIIVAERDAEWNVRCEELEAYGFKDFPVRYLSEREIRVLLEKLEKHESLGLLREIPNFEDRVKKLVNASQRQLLVALHEATLGKAFEDIVFEEYHRIIPSEAQAMYLDICTLNRLGVAVRAGLIARVSGIGFNDFEGRFFKPLEHIVRAEYDKYIGDHVYSARHQHVAEMVFDRVLVEPEARYDQIIRIMRGMNLDYSSDRVAFSQTVRGHGISQSLRSRELGRALYDIATQIAPREPFLFQQRAIFEMEEGGDLLLADRYLNEAKALDPRSQSVQHSLAVLFRRQAQATKNLLQRQKLRDRAKAILNPLLGGAAEHSYGYHTAAQIALDELRDILGNIDTDTPDPLDERRIVETARDLERYEQEGLQRVPMNEHLLALESDYRKLIHQDARAEAALRKAFNGNPRQDWVAIRFAKTLDASGKHEEAIAALVKCLQENPTSKKAHYELATLCKKHNGDNDLIIEHLRRSFTTGDQNFEAQFWYAREAFIAGKTADARAVFEGLRKTTIPAALRNKVRGVIADKGGRSVVYFGEVVTVEDAYLFVQSPELSERIFVHRTRVDDDKWVLLKRGTKVAFTVGFNMRGPTVETIHPAS